MSSGSPWIEEIRDGNSLIRSPLPAEAGSSPVLRWCCCALQMLISPVLPKACPSLLVGCFLDQMQSWCSVTDFRWSCWGSCLLRGVVGRANSKRELRAPAYAVRCFDLVGNAQILFFGVRRQDVRRFGNVPPPEGKLLKEQELNTKIYVLLQSSC